MKILVTGCAGFIGAATCKALLQEGHNVVGVDNLNHDYSQILKQARIKDVGMTFYFDDVSRPYFIHSVINTEGPFQAVYHFASKAGVRHSLEDPESYIQNNVIGTLNILEVCKQYGIPHIIFSSTSSVYPNNGTQFREDEPLEIVCSPYAASKLSAEHLISSYVNNYDIKATIFRYFTVYGPWGRPDMAVLKFMQKTYRTQPIQVYGDGFQERDFTYIDDIVRANIAALTLGREKKFNIINLGSNRPQNINKLIYLIHKELNKVNFTDYEPARKEEMVKTHADINRAEALLGWKPTVRLEDGIKKTAEWFIEQGSKLF